MSVVKAIAIVEFEDMTEVSEEWIGVKSVGTFVGVGDTYGELMQARLASPSEGRMIWAV